MTTHQIDFSTVGALAKELGCSRNRLLRLIEVLSLFDDLAPLSIQVGNRRLYRRSEILSLIKP